MISTSYQPNADALHLGLAPEGTEMTESREGQRDVMMEFDRQGRLVGIEALDVGRRWADPKAECVARHPFWAGRRPDRRPRQAIFLALVPSAPQFNVSLYEKRRMIGRRHLPLLASALALPALGARAQAAAREFRVGTITPAHHTWNVAIRNFGEELRASSEGRFSLTQFPSGQLGNEATMLQQLQTGALDMSLMTTAELTNRVEALGALHAPFLVGSIQQGIAALRSAPALGLLNTLPQTVGCVGVRYCMTGLRNILMRDAAATLADIRGRKIRITPAAPIRDFYVMIGTAPIPLPLPQVFDALANGQIDGLELDHESVLNGRFQEVARTMLLSNHSMFPGVGLISGRTWAGLAPADRDLVRALMAKHLDALADGMVQVEVDNLARLRQSRMEIRPVGADFFGDAVAQWDRAWGPRAPALAQLRAIAARA